MPLPRIIKEESNNHQFLWKILTKLRVIENLKKENYTI